MSEIMKWILDPNDELPVGIIEDTEEGYGVADFPDTGGDTALRAIYASIANQICSAHNAGMAD